MYSQQLMNKSAGSSPKLSHPTFALAGKGNENKWDAMGKIQQHGIISAESGISS